MWKRHNIAIVLVCLYYYLNNNVAAKQFYSSLSLLISWKLVFFVKKTIYFITLCISVLASFLFKLFCTANGEGIFGGGTGDSGVNPHTKLEDGNCPRQTWIPTPHHINARNMHHCTYSFIMSILFAVKFIISLSFKCKIVE